MDSLALEVSVYPLSKTTLPQRNIRLRRRIKKNVRSHERAPPCTDHSCTVGGKITTTGSQKSNHALPVRTAFLWYVEHPRAPWIRPTLVQPPLLDIPCLMVYSIGRIILNYKYQPRFVHSSLPSCLEKVLREI
jgi:hypothetical protein